MTRSLRNVQRVIRRAWLLIGLVLAGTGPVALAGAQETPTAAAPVMAQLAVPNFAALARRYGPAVVNISVTREVTQMGVQLPPGIAPDNPLAPFLARRVIGNREEVSLGSGFIVSADGYILTNRHVVGDAAAVDVKLTDKREFKGKVIGSDALSDVALVKIDSDNLPVVVTGRPERTSVGDWVMAIGSPYGFANTVTAGIVSAKSRSLPGEAYIPFIQTDVPINPGNSGGPLFDLDGRVIAINSMIYSKTGSYQGLSFAIPIDVALNVKEQLLKTGHVSRGRLGVAVQEVSQSLAQSFGLAKPDGALISMVEAGGPAAQAGLRPGDVVQAVDGVEIGESADLLTTVAKIRPGRTADLLVWRSRTAALIEVTVGELDSNGSPVMTPTPARLGVTVRPLTQQEQQSVGVDHGLLVQQVSGAGARTGLKAGDIVLSVNETPVTSIEEMAEQIRQARGSVALLIQRGAARLYLPVSLG
ncbi:Periplasmic pH-dependent serine endoprotease DegQ [Paraburkholderia sediminicola]|uniref:Probable periplasmic serine endoprotease DegP-like n=1 Tax=Paraburkholderia sediminicola TaxID=458836 RepID=A0A6J4ZUM0_9BURK|nr:Do family serine endopeptidase [Paraburkholderia sediminicola]CAB3643344.1 Periplasmic pH-dependent serine endoprotease DegQ [Paraburkholderia sediminicola]